MKTVLTGKNILPLVILLGLAVMLSGCVQSSRRAAGRPGPAAVLQKYDASGLLQFEPRQEISLLMQAKPVNEPALNNKIQEAEEQAHRSRDEHGEKSDQYAKNANNLAVLLMQRGNVVDYDQVDSLLAAAFAYWQEQVGVEHPVTATIVYNIGWLFSWRDDEDSKLSEKMFLAALGVRGQQLGSSPETATSLQTLGDWYLATGDYKKAAKSLDRAMYMWAKEIWPEQNKKRVSINHAKRLKIIKHLCNHLLIVYTQLNQPDQIKVIQEILSSLQQSQQRQLVEADKLNSRLSSLFKQGKYQEAVLAARQCLAIRETVLGAEDPDTIDSLHKLIALYTSVGAYSKAASIYQRVLSIDEKTFGPNHPRTATSLNFLGWLYFSYGAYSKAEPLYKRALAIREKALGPDHPDTATSLNHLALLYDSLGAYSKAEPLLKRALAIDEKALGPNHPDTATCLNNLAALYSSLDAYSKAELLYKRALTINEKTLGPDHPHTAGSLDNLAFLHLAQGKVDQALAHFRKTGNAGGLGCCFLAERRFNLAKEKFSGDLTYVRNRPGYEEATIAILIGLGRAEQGLGNLEAARTSFREAVDLIEAQYKTLSPEARRTFLGGNTQMNFKRINAYEGLILALVREQGPDYAKKSLQVAEQVKSRLLLEQLAARDAGATTGRDAEMLKKDRQFQLKISMLYKELAVLDKLIREGKQVGRGRRTEVSRDLARQQKEYEQFINQVKLNNWELASLISVQTVDIGEIQGLLDPDTTIVEYFTGDKNSYVWTISKNSVHVRQLDMNVKKVAGLINDYRSHLIPGSAIRSVNREAAMVLVAANGPYRKIKPGRDQENRRNLKSISQILYKHLLAPVKDEVKTSKLIIVPHGPLHKLPFNALHDGNRYLMEEYAISTAPSASVLSYVINKRNPNQNKLLAFANPKTIWPSLPGTENEVAHISPLFSGTPEVYKRTNATETRARLNTSGSDVIHFASHGEFNERQPMQSGLLLSKDKENDGKLQVHEIFDLDLKGVNLVTLSACETALAKIESGDDMVGLSRGFIYAGTPSLLASLWSVDDDATRILMEQFYKNWLRKKMSKPESLRQAQIMVKNLPGKSDPYYWAAFELIGDWL